MKPKKLYKTTLVIWTEYDTDMVASLEDLAREATSGEGYCESSECYLITDPDAMPDTEFFDCPNDCPNCDGSGRDLSVVRRYEQSVPRRIASNCNRGEDMKRTAVQTRRLRAWAKKLRQIRSTKTKQFDIDAWHDPLYKQNDGSVNEMAVTSFQKPCGFAACAVGWLPHMFEKFAPMKGTEIEDIKEPSQFEVQKYFGLTEDELGEVVYSDHYAAKPVTPKMVAKRLEQIATGTFVTSDGCGDSE